MVKTVMSTLTMASVAADDVTSMLQLSASLHKSRGQRIVAAIAAQGTETICVPAVVGNIAPVTGSFTATGSQQVVVVEAGSVANKAGTFCVAKQDVLLIQRTLGLNTASDFEVALGQKSRPATTTTTTTKADWDDFDFEGDITKIVTVKADGCPNVEAGLVQTVDASVSDKQRRKKADKNKLDADQLQVCGCRNFLKSTVNTPNFVETIHKLQAELEAAEGEGQGGGAGANSNLLQRNLDTALGSKKAAKKAKTTTTTTTTIDHKLTPEFAALAQACTGVANWTRAAKEINNPLYRDLFESFNITGGWEHCDKSWKVQSACNEFVLPDTDEVGGDTDKVGGNTGEDTNAGQSWIAVDRSCLDGSTGCNGGCYQWPGGEDFFGNCLQGKSPVVGIVMPDPVVVRSSGCAEMGFAPLTELADGSPFPTPHGNSDPDSCYGYPRGAGSRISFFTTDQKWFWDTALAGGFNPRVQCPRWRAENPQCYDAPSTVDTR